MNAEVSNNSNEAYFSWEPNADVSSWEVKTYIPGVGSTSTATVYTNSYTAAGLLDQTTYEYYVRALCSGGNSDWVGPYSFTTNCIENSMPYVENFESYTPNVANNCWADLDVPTDVVIKAPDLSHDTTINYPYSGSYYTFTAQAGTSYKLYAWGAQGGDAYYSSTSYGWAYGGKGGYSYGTFTPSTTTTVYVYVGGQGTDNNSTTGTLSGGYNGGGTACYYSGGGGGATHFATRSGLLQDLSSYKNSDLLLVAGAGGGGYHYNSSSTSYCYQGGYGGGSTGGSGSAYSYYGTGGSQSSYGYSSYSSSYCQGGFGYGGNYYSTGSSYATGGGGAGLYGGGAAYQRGSGGGGSGYTNTSLLTNYATKAGNTSFASTTGSTETGHSGNGYAQVKYRLEAYGNKYLALGNPFRSTTVHSPVLTLDPGTQLGDYIVKFDATCTAAGKELYVGTVENNQFLPIDTVSSTAANTTETFSINLNSYAGTSTIIAFQTGVNTYFQIDNISCFALLLFHKTLRQRSPTIRTKSS